MAEESTGRVRCPVCAGEFEPLRINAHLDACLLQPAPGGEDGPPAKKSRTGREAESAAAPGGTGTEAQLDASPPAALFPVFTPSRATPRMDTEASASRGVTGATLPQRGGAALSALLSADRPLADSMRPSTLEDYFGQNKVVGEQTLLRSLLESQEIPSLILWGPPGCGKTTLAHIISSSSKKKGTARFVTLSATSTSTNEVREVIKQAQNELRLCRRKTILFIDEIHRFNKSQQDTFLPHVECGTVTLIGATTENPSFQVNSALLSRCRVLVLEKLSVEAMTSILRRAVGLLGLHVLLDEDPEQGCSTSAEQCSEPWVCIEQKALDTLAYLCDGDARAGLNGLQLAVQACLAKARASGPRPAQPVLVQEEHVKEGLQRSHILYDKAGEEHYNCISALHKSMRGSDENAALYWLGRMLEGGEDPLYVARRLVRFSSEDVGLADPAALPQAVAAFQACHFIGMPECEVILAQCVVYLTRAPKSVEVYKAYDSVKACLRNHKGPLPPVPFHLRNAPTRLMKELGYAKNYKYNPAFKGPVDQEYLPAELCGINFFTWKPSDL
ncbi:ATPase WRNIP1 [Electrophorus electricus]|uniref:WRN helicase interacting protein 1 n=1 Tax=Electrophorus electricus TaxID=8005 RepID=A0A4W4DMP0_ELEEL|nr:ATPase WRNIP1 [Electrophorus electricus]